LKTHNSELFYFSIFYKTLQFCTSEMYPEQTFTYRKYVNQIKLCTVTLWSYKQLVDWHNTTVNMHNMV